MEYSVFSKSSGVDVMRRLLQNIAHEGITRDRANNATREAVADPFRPGQAHVRERLVTVVGDARHIEAGYCPVRS